MRKNLLLALFVLLSVWQAVYAQNSITGKVSTKEGQPLEGVTVSVKNSTVSTVTHKDGTFTINAPAKGSLVFSYVGFQSIEVTSPRNPLNVTLTAGTNSLTDVVVVGYGTSLRRDITGSVAKVAA